jgi:hypothetical protein
LLYINISSKGNKELERNSGTRKLRTRQERDDRADVAQISSIIKRSTLFSTGRAKMAAQRRVERRVFSFSSRRVLLNAEAGVRFAA